MLLLLLMVMMTVMMTVMILCVIDARTVHAAIIAINDAVDHCVAMTTLSCLLNPAAHMSNIIHDLCEDYQSTLFDAKQIKKEIAFDKVES